MCLPFYYRADKIRKEEEKKISEIKPYVDKIKKNFKGDELFFMLQTLYRQHNYNPIMALRNSFSLLLQIPFFIAAYHFFSNLELLNGYSWGPIQDFSKPDMLINFNGLSINLLPIIMTVVNIISCEVYLKTKTLRARIQPYSFALLFLVLLYNSPSALVLYWTSNNFFYLLKNKYMDDDNPLKFVYGLSAFMTVAFIFCKLCDLENLELIALQLFYLLIPYVIIYLILKYRDENHDDFKSITNNLIGGYVTKIFVLCSFGLILLQGVIIPLGLLTSDISMFAVELGNTGNIIKFVLENALCVVGLYLIWGSIILYFTKKEFRTKLVVVFMSLYVFSLFNYLNFGKNLGTLDTSLRFESENVEEIISGDLGLQCFNIFIFASILAFTIWMLKKSYIRQTRYILFAILLTEIIVSVVYSSNFVNNINYIDNLTKKNKELWAQNKYIELSKTNKNVIVIFLDRFLGAFLPKILEEKPELKKAYSGFVFYPNTVSYAVNTVLGYPACIGGYEYAPIPMDKDKRGFSEKWLESSLMLLTLFKKNDYLATVVDPIGDYDPFMRFYKDDNFDNIYSAKGFNYIKMAGKYVSKFQNDELKDFKIQEQIKKRLYLYSFLNIVPLSFKSYIYDNGFYLLTRRSDETDNHIYYSQKALISAYSSLLYLKNITKSESNKNTFTLIHNDLSHCLNFFHYPSYEYSKDKTNIGVNKFNNNFTFMAYHSAMASAILVGQYLDYLKHSEVYNNSRIIIMSDHGNKYVRFPEYSDFNNEIVVNFNPLLMVKDFNQNSDLKIDNTFMTNADVPYIATKDIISNPQNPFTGKILSSNSKLNGVYVYMDHKNWNAYQFTSNRVILDSLPKIMHVKDNIFNEANWKDIEYNYAK